MIVDYISHLAWKGIISPSRLFADSGHLKVCVTNIEKQDNVCLAEGWRVILGPLQWNIPWGFSCFEKKVFSQELLIFSLILNFLCELLRYEDDSRKADVLKKREKIIFGNLRMCLSVAGLIKFSRSTNQACGIMVLIYNYWGGNSVWTLLKHSWAQSFLRYALCLPLSNNMEQLRVDVSHNLLLESPIGILLTANQTCL